MQGGRLGLGEGTALYIGGVLGPGVLVLPALAVAKAGPASLVAWAGLLALSVPVAMGFAALGARFPDGGGVSAFAEHAFGRPVSACVGWWFYAAVPVGVLAGAMIGGVYVAEALGLGKGAATAGAVVILAAAFAANCVGLQLSGRIQLLLVALLVLLLAVTMAAAAPHMSSAGFSPFLPGGWTSIGSAAVVLFYAFSGWEAASHLSAEFARPRRDLPIATGLTVAVVGVLYLGLSLVTVGVLGEAAGTSDVPLMLLLERGIGAPARTLTAAAAVCLTFGAVNTFIAGAARLGAALGRDGALPGWLAKGGGAGEVPRRSLTVQAALTAVLAAVVAATGGTPLDLLMRATASLLASVTVVGMASAVVLLPRRTPLWWAASVAAVFTVVVLLFSGRLLSLPALVAGCAVLHLRIRSALRRHAGRPRCCHTVASPSHSGNDTVASAVLAKVSGTWHRRDMASLNVGDLGEYLREQRRNAQLSLRQLAEAAGVSNPYLSQIERGLRKPSAEILQQLAKALRISAETLYVQAGILDERDRDAVEVHTAILTDPLINEKQKQVLLQIYESFRRENDFPHDREGAGEGAEAGTDAAAPAEAGGA